MSLTVLGIVASGEALYALRGDGAVFRLLKSGDLLPDGRRVVDPFWAVCPAVPGTEAAVEQAG